MYQQFSRFYILVTFGHVDVHVMALLLPLLSLIRNFSNFFVWRCCLGCYHCPADVWRCDLYLHFFPSVVLVVAHVLVFVVDGVVKHCIKYFPRISSLSSHFSKKMVNRSMLRCLPDDFRFFTHVGQIEWTRMCAYVQRSHNMVDSK